MSDPAALLQRPLADVARALRMRAVSARDLLEACIARHAAHGAVLHAYKHWDPDGAWKAADRADRILETGDDPPPLCGIPVSVKDLFGVRGMPTFAGTARRLPPRWEEEGWLVSSLRKQGAVFVGKTHTVELAYGALGNNPHWGTPLNPWSPEEHRVPGGSSCGAGVSLLEGSALVALGTDTGGSIRIPASMTGVVGHKTTKGRWPTTGVVPLSSTLDTVGALTRSAADAAWVFAALDPRDGAEVEGALDDRLAPRSPAGLRLGLPDGGIWRGCQGDIRTVLEETLDELEASGARPTDVEGALLDEAADLYLHGGIAGAECRAFLESELPGWMDTLHPTVGARLAAAPSLESAEYRTAVERRRRLMSQSPRLFQDVDVVVLPTHIRTPLRLADLEDYDAYVDANAAALTPTAPVSILGLCALTLPVGLDAAGMPVGLQLVAPGGADDALLAIARGVEDVLGTAPARPGPPPTARTSPPSDAQSRGHQRR